MRYSIVSKNQILPAKYSKEGLFFEAKSAKEGIPPDFWETYSAFANTFGGTVIFGISENEDHSLYVTGVERPEETVKTLFSNLNNPRFTNYNLLLDKDVIIEELCGKTVIIINIPPAERGKRPIYIRNNINSGTYKRNNEGDYHCRMDEIKEMLRDSTDTDRDSEPLIDMGINCLDNETVNSYLKELNAHRPNHPWTTMDRDEFLISSRSAAMVDGILHPTAAGLLMFGKANCILGAFPDYFLDYRECLSENRWDYRLHSNSGDWSGNLYDFVSRVMVRISAKMGIRFELDGYMNNGGSDTFISVREAVINGVIHADYRVRGGVQIQYLQDRITVHNPGTMRISAKKAKEGGYSDPRNTILMALAMAVGWSERVGSGIYMMEKARKQGKLSELQIIELTDPSSVKLILEVAPRQQSDNPNMDRVLNIIADYPTATKKDIAAELGLSVATVSNVLAALKLAGRIERVGSNKTGSWKIIR